MPKEHKVRLVEELRDKLHRSTICIGTNFQGLSVREMTNLRRRLRAQGLEYRVVKNTLAYIAAREAGKTGIEAVVQGPTGVLFGYGDPVEPAKALEEYIRSTRSALSIRGALMEGRVLTPEEVRRLATLASRDQLVAQLLGQLQVPIVRLLYVLTAPLQGLAIVLQRHVEQLERGPGAVPTPEAQPAAEPPSQETSAQPATPPGEEAETAERDQPQG